MTDFKQGFSQENDKQLIVRFYHDSVENKFKSHAEGRPVFDDVEMVEIAFPADRNKTFIVPAHATFFQDGTQAITYAQRFAEHYARFKANEGPVVTGTPLSEAPFLSMADKASLKALQVYTIEQLAGLSGQALKNIGTGGLAKQQAAVAYLETAKGTADTVKLKSEIEELQRQIAELRGGSGEIDPSGSGGAYDGKSADELKDLIQSKTGARPRGNPSVQTLISMLTDLDKEAAEAA